jgi:putative membrane protein insertion efficiency factor
MSLSRMLAKPLVWLVRAYQQLISPMRPPTCRYYPSCSAYAVTALERYGLLRGSWMAAKRIGRCHPWTPGGVDHVPERDPDTGRPIPGTTGPRQIGPYPPPGADEADDPGQGTSIPGTERRAS